MTVASYWVEGVSQKSKYQKEAFEFMKFLSEKQTQQKLYSEAVKTRFFGEPYSIVSLANSVGDNPLVFPFLEQAEGAQSSYFVSDTFDNGLDTRLNSYLGDAVRSILKGNSTESAIETLSNGAIQIYQQYGIQQ